MDTPSLLLDQSHGVLTVTLNQPDKLNALDLPQWRDLAHALAYAHHDASVRAVVLTGAGRAFSAGADVAGMREQRDAAQQLARLNQINPTIQQLAELPKPTIAALNGVAAGIGASLALACDLVVAAASASLVCSWVKIGLAPDGGVSWRLVHSVGPRRAKELILTARPLLAAEAQAWGLVNEVVPDGQLLERAEALAREIAAFSVHALRHAKSLVDQAATASLDAQLTAEAQAQAECVETEEFRAAVAAFLERRSVKLHKEVPQ
jgi:2-(1,2-epoxy-1,2-dihydrophenyl)acetyl-CoA isomerase